GKGTRHELTRDEGVVSWEEGEEKGKKIAFSFGAPKGGQRVAENDQEKKGKLRISCPCKECNHILMYIDSNEIKGHLISTGFVERYTFWSWHGELLPEHDTVDSDHSEDDDNDLYDSGHDNLVSRIVCRCGKTVIRRVLKFYQAKCSVEIV
ncbi:RNA-directed DNA polymerase, eukaryota, partial [Tanacetum coccineum]